MAMVILVHGTTAGGWVWRKVAPRLREAGHTVYTPTLTGLGERVHLATPEVGLTTHIDDIVNTLIFEELTDVVLAGHSYGGMVITGVADRVPERIGRLIYLDAVVPEDGESLVDLLSPARREATARSVAERGEGWLIPIERRVDERASHNVAHPYKTWTEPVRLHDPAAFAAVPRDYLLFTADKVPGAPFEGVMDRSLARARAAGWAITEVPTMHQITPDPDSKTEALLAIL